MARHYLVNDAADVQESRHDLASGFSVYEFDASGVIVSVDTDRDLPASLLIAAAHDDQVRARHAAESVNFSLRNIDPRTFDKPAAGSVSKLLEAQGMTEATLVEETVNNIAMLLAVNFTTALAIMPELHAMLRRLDGQA